MNLDISISKYIVQLRLKSNLWFSGLFANTIGLTQTQSIPLDSSGYCECFYTGTGDAVGDSLIPS